MIVRFDFCAFLASQPPARRQIQLSITFGGNFIPAGKTEAFLWPQQTQNHMETTTGKTIRLDWIRHRAPSPTNFLVFERARFKRTSR